MVDGSRRAFLRGGFLSRQGREEHTRRQQPLGPYPPWLERVAAGGRCRDCSAPCVAACPEKIVRTHHPEHSRAGQPYLVFYTSGCTYCGECARACPVQPLREPEKPILGIARIDQQRCLPWQQINCYSCRGSCPEDALVFDSRSRPAVETAACNGCGRCVPRCPVNAITVAASAATVEGTRS
jgi:ferredoxin-type protein NapF